MLIRPTALAVGRPDKAISVTPLGKTSLLSVVCTDLKPDRRCLKASRQTQPYTGKEGNNKGGDLHQ